MISLLDSPAVSDWRREDTAFLDYVESLAPPASLVTCSIVRGEILFGIQHMGEGHRRRQFTMCAQRLFTLTPCIAVTSQAAEAYADLKVTCEKAGRTMADNDLCIAATTLAAGATLRTRDRDFDQVAGLRTVNWTQLDG